MSITIEEMIKNAVHFGHRKNRWNPRMKPYIYTQVNGVHLFNLEKTKHHLEKLLEFLKKTVEEGKIILFVSTKPQTAELIPEVAGVHGFPYVTQKWFGGLLTNFGTMKERIRYYKNLKEQQSTGEFEKYTKKEAVKFEKEILKLEKALGGIENIRRLPDVLFVVDGKRDIIAINEARKLRIPVVGICDSNADPKLYDYFVPANDDAMKSLDYLLKKVKETLLSAKPKTSSPGENRAMNNKPMDNKAMNHKPADNKPADNKPAESKPAESKPADSKPEENETKKEEVSAA